MKSFNCPNGLSRCCIEPLFMPSSSSKNYFCCDFALFFLLFWLARTAYQKFLLLIIISHKCCFVCQRQECIHEEVLLLCWCSHQEQLKWVQWYLPVNRKQYNNLLCHNLWWASNQKPHLDVENNFVPSSKWLPPRTWSYTSAGQQQQPDPGVGGPMCATAMANKHHRIRKGSSLGVLILGDFYQAVLLTDLRDTE